MIIRFWLIAAICVASALAIFIGDFTRIAAELIMRALVYGLAVTGASTVRALRRRGHDGRGRRRPHRRRQARSRRRRSASSCCPTPADDRRRSSRQFDLRVAVAGRARDARRDRRRTAPRRPGAQRDRARLPVGAGPARRRPADARDHRHRRQDDDEPAHGRDADAPPACARSLPATPTIPLVDALEMRRRRLRRRVHAASGWRGPSSSAPTPRSGSTWRPTTSTGTAR